MVGVFDGVVDEDADDLGEVGGVEGDWRTGAEVEVNNFFGESGVEVVDLFGDKIGDIGGDFLNNFFGLVNAGEEKEIINDIVGAENVGFDVPCPGLLGGTQGFKVGLDDGNGSFELVAGIGDEFFLLDIGFTDRVDGFFGKITTGGEDEGLDGEADENEDEGEVGHVFAVV